MTLGGSKQLLKLYSVLLLYCTVLNCACVKCSSLTPHPDTLHTAQEGTDGAVFGFGTQELRIFVGELDVPQLPPAVQTS